jgi:hypothetical protein
MKRKCILAIIKILEDINEKVGFQHNDIKGGNVGFKKDNFYLIDFGKSKTLNIGKHPFICREDFIGIVSLVRKWLFDNKPPKLRDKFNKDAGGLVEGKTTFDDLRRIIPV